jgi:hypothetical protein
MQAQKSEPHSHTKYKVHIICGTENVSSRSVSIITEVLYPNKGINIQASGFIPTNAKIQHVHLRS